MAGSFSATPARTRTAVVSSSGLSNDSVEIVGRTVHTADTGHDGEAAHECEVELVEAYQRGDQIGGGRADQVNAWNHVTRHGRSSPVPR